MIIYVEERKLVVEGYTARFRKAGEMLMRLTGNDLLDWLNTSSQSELASLEAVIVGECASSREVLRTVRRKVNVPIVAILDHRSLEQLIVYYQEGVDDVVVKPVHYEELLARLGAIKRRIVQPVTTGASKVAEPITIYYDGRDPEVGGKPILLPRRERRILEYLASINGRRATKAQIFGAVYGVFDEQIDENVVESHISKLRKKLRQQLKRDPIDSKRYLGYRLDPKLVHNAAGNFQAMVA